MALDLAAQQAAEDEEVLEPRHGGGRLDKAMRRAAEAAYGELADRVALGATWVELLFEIIEESHIEAAPLTRVVCVEDGE